MEYCYYTLNRSVFPVTQGVFSVHTNRWGLTNASPTVHRHGKTSSLSSSLMIHIISQVPNLLNFQKQEARFSVGDSDTGVRGCWDHWSTSILICFTGQTDRKEEDWKNQSCLKPWTWPPWVRCYCPVGMNGDDRWAGRGWVGFGRRLSDSSRELEGVAGGWGLAGQTAYSFPVFWRAKASTKLWQKRVDGLNIWNVNSTKRNPEQMWNNYWSDTYRHVCHFTQHYIKVL